ncbi:MAG: leucyl/phenylalanyl-tRNA--protein transferase [Bacteroidetes bacterium]|nr:MAG: leucyl/phenylalanyl-tRNA--protein transferase [Bacteroidota bacterium]
MVFLLSDEIIFPNPLLADKNGLLAVGGDLNIDRLLLAYSMGIFPWFNPSEDILWWASPYRPIYTPGKIHLSKSLKQTIRKHNFEIRVDTNFKEVINYCGSIARNGQEGTWISDEIINTYQILFDIGYLHTVEVYLENKLVGGLYGISLGKAFFGESMFHLMPNTSKIALFALSELLKNKGFHFIDSQVTNPHGLRMGAHEVTNVKFDRMVKEAMKYDDDIGKWDFNLGNLRELIK